MASEREAEKDLRAHFNSYARFVALLKWGTILSLITAAIVILLIAG